MGTEEESKKLRPRSEVYLCGPIAEPGRPANGGYQAANLRTIEALEDRGIDVHALHYAQPGSSRVRKIIEYASGFFTLSLRMASCKKNSIVHITGLRRAFIYPELVLVYLAKLRKCRVIYDVRDGLELDAVWLRRSALYRWFFSRLLNSVDLVMVEGHTQIPFVESFTGKTPVSFPNLIDVSSIPARNYAPEASKALKLAYAGALKPEKGISTILDAAEILDQRGFEVLVRIAGRGDESFVADLQNRYRHLNVEWLGAQTAERVLELFADSHFFVFPTRWPGEGQSNALTEAMACGCVPIASDHGFNAATVGDCGAILDLRQPAADYASAIQRIWESGAWEELSHRATARIRQHFSSVSVIDNLIDQYLALERAV